MVRDKHPLPNAPTLVSRASMQSVLKKYQEGLITEKSLSEALESSVNRLENSGASAIEAGKDSTNTTGAPQNSMKAAKKSTPVASSKNFSLQEIDDNAIFGLELSLKECIPTYLASNQSVDKVKNAAVEPASPNSPFVIDLVEENGSAQKRPRLNESKTPGAVCGIGRWLQLRDMNAKIWVSFSDD